MTTPPQVILPATAREPRETNDLAVVSLIFGIMSYFFVVIPFGVFNIPAALVALHQIKTRREGGRGFAIAALVLSGVHTLIYGAIYGAVSSHCSAGSGSQRPRCLLARLWTGE
jgi:Domain of unknown function (DUF4190)